jgi:hypothetical protein
MKAMELAAYCFAPERSAPEPQRAVLAALHAQCLEWLQATRYRAFVDDQRDKIRRKVRGASDEESLRDLWAELAVAERLLRHRHVALEYERYAAEKHRGPDFTVTYTTKLRFNVEVRRLRTFPTMIRWLEVLCDKLGQMPASSINVLYVAASLPDAVRSAPEDQTSFDLAATMAQIRLAAERREDRLFQRCGIESDGRVAPSRGYLQSLLRLSAIVLWQGWDTAIGGRADIWKNDQAKFPIPREAQMVLGREEPRA